MFLLARTSFYRSFEPLFWERTLDSDLFIVERSLTTLLLKEKFLNAESIRNPSFCEICIEFGPSVIVLRLFFHFSPDVWNS